MAATIPAAPAWRRRSTQLVKAEAVVFPIGIFDAANQDQNPKVLARIAEVTGGESFLPSRSSRTSPGSARRSPADVRRQYTLGFAGAEDGQYHQIEVTASDPKHGAADGPHAARIFCGETAGQRESQRA